MNVLNHPVHGCSKVLVVDQSENPGKTGDLPMLKGTELLVEGLLFGNDDSTSGVHCGHWF